MISLIIPSAGFGKRSGSAVPKQFVTLLDKPIIVHTLLAFVGKVHEVIISVDENFVQTTNELIQELKDKFQRIEIVIGGAERQNSIYNALQHISPNSEIVLVHDAARPNPSAQLIDEVIKYAKIFDGATPGIAPADTIKQVFTNNYFHRDILQNDELVKNEFVKNEFMQNEGEILLVEKTLNRSALVATQTPQGFKPNILKAAYKRAIEQNYLGTDDASLVELNNGRVAITKGEPTNLKITYPIDFKIAALYIAERENFFK